MNFNKEYEELRAIIDGGSESMTHEDAVQLVRQWAESSFTPAAHLEQNKPRTGCGDCDPLFQCYNGQAKCLRLNTPPAAPAPVAQKPTYSEEEVERAVITLRGITQEIRGRGIGAVMLLEEQIKSLSAAPVVREPLTDEQITQGARNTAIQCMTLAAAFKAGVRLAEAHHGIGITGASK